MDFSSIRPMSKAHAVEIAAWTYEQEYSIYSFFPGEETLRELLSGDYYACLDQDEAIIGFFCFGTAAQIPAIEEEIYTPVFLDIGLGMRPDLCGHGLGERFIENGLDFARDLFHPEQVRLTVAAFNLRAIRLYEKLGFKHTADITHRITHKPFRVMIRRC